MITEILLKHQTKQVGQVSITSLDENYRRSVRWAHGGCQRGGCPRGRHGGSGWMEGQEAALGTTLHRPWGPDVGRTDALRILVP